MQPCRSIRRARRRQARRRLTSAPASQLQQLEPRRLFSTVAGTPDPYENNGLQRDAYVLPGATGSLTDTLGNATATNDDWYRITAGAGDFSVTLDSTPAEGELNLQVFNAAGELLAGNYRSESSSTVGLTLADETELFAFVYGKGGYQGNVYDLTWTGTEVDGGTATPAFPGPPADPNGVRFTVPEAGVADAFEDNDRPGTGPVLAGVSSGLRNFGSLATATDDDWYTLRSLAGEVTVTLDSFADQGELNLQVFDDNLNLLAGAYRQENTSSVTLDLTTDQELQLFVYGKGGYQGNLYDLNWTGRTAPFPTDPDFNPDPEPTNPDPAPVDPEPANPDPAPDPGQGGGEDPTTPTTPVNPDPADGEDAYEENDLTDDAFFLSAASGRLSELAGLATATDNDWYLVNAATGTFTAQLDSVPSEGELNLQVFSTDLQLLDADYDSETTSEVSVDVARPTQLLVYVYSGQRAPYEGNTYDLSWTGAGATIDPDAPVPGPETEPNTDPAPVPTGGIDLVSNLGQQFQNIDGFGTNLAWYYDDPFGVNQRSIFEDPAFIDGYYNTLDANVVRIDLLPYVLSEGGGIAPERAQLDDPIRLSADTDANIELFNFDAVGVGHITDTIREGVARQGDDFRLIGSIWTPPHWMKGPTIDGRGPGPDFVNLRDSAGGSLIDTPDNLEQFGRYVTAWVKGYERATGVTLDAIAIQNELRFAQSSFNSARYTPDLFDRALDAVRDAFDAHNAANPDDPITTRLQGPEDVGVGRTVDQFFINQQLNYIDDPANPNGVETLEDLDVISIHGYTGAGVEVDGPRDGAVQWAEYRDRLAERLDAQGLDLPSWMTEHSGEDPAWLFVHPTESFGGAGNAGEQYGAFALAVSMHDALAFGDVSMYLYWQATGTRPRDAEFSLAQDTNFDTNKVAAFRHFSQFINAGADRFEVASNSDDRLVSGYENPDGTLTYVIINLSDTADRVNLGVPGSATGDDFRVFQSSENQRFQSLADRSANADGAIAIDLPRFSVTTVTTARD